MQVKDLKKGTTYYNSEYGTNMKFIEIQKGCTMNAPDTRFVFQASFTDGEPIGKRYLVESSLKALS